MCVYLIVNRKTIFTIYNELKMQTEKATKKIYSLNEKDKKWKWNHLSIVKLMQIKAKMSAHFDYYYYYYHCNYYYDYYHYYY